MSKNEVDEACQSFQDAMISFAKTKEGRKQLHNYILHMKDKTIGKRTGKPVRFTTDLDNLFISSPASSEIDVSDTDESAHLNDESAHLNPPPDPDPVASTSLTPHVIDHEHTGTGRSKGKDWTLNLSGHNVNHGHRTPTQLTFNEREKHLSYMSEHQSQDATPQSVRLDATLIEPMTKYQLHTDGTKDGSFSMEPISSQHEYDGGLKTAKINKRLTFSEQLKRLQTPNPAPSQKQTLHKQPVKKKDTQKVISALPISQIDEDSSYASDDSFEDQFVVEPVSGSSRLSASPAEAKRNKSKLNKTAKHKETNSVVPAKQPEVVTDVPEKPKVSRISKLRTPKKHTRVVQSKQLETSAANTTKHGDTDLTAHGDISADVSKKSQPTHDKPHQVRNTARKTINNSRQFQTDVSVKSKKTNQASRHEIDDTVPSHNLSTHSLQSVTQKATVSNKNAVEANQNMSYSLRSNQQHTETTDIGGMESYSAQTIPTDQFVSLTEPLTSSKNKRTENRVEKSSSKQKNKRKKFLNISEQEMLDDDVSPTKRRRTVQRKKSQPELLNRASNNARIKEWLNSNLTDDPPSIVLSPHKPTKHSKTGKSSKSTQRSSRRLEKPDHKTAPVLNKPHANALAQSDVTEDITETIHHAVFPAVDQSTIIHPHEVSTRKNVLGPPASTPRRAYGRHRSKKVKDVVEPSALLIDIIADDSLPSINQSPDSYSEQFPSNIENTGNTTAPSRNGKVNDSHLSKNKSKPQKSKKAKSKDSNKTKEKQHPKHKPAQSTNDKVDYDTDKTINPPRATKGKKGRNKIKKRSNVHDDLDKTITPPKRRYQRKRNKDDTYVGSTSKSTSMRPTASRKQKSKIKKLQDTCIFISRPVEIIKPDAADNDGLRRSKRVRTRPLDPWEKLVYGDNGEPVGVQVDEWTTDVWFAKPKQNRAKPTTKTRKRGSKMAAGGDEQTLDPSSQTLDPETSNDNTSASQQGGRLNKKKKPQRGGNKQGEPEKSVDMTTSYQQKKSKNKRKKPVQENNDETSGKESQQEPDFNHPPPSPTLDTTTTPQPTPITQGERKRRGNRRKNDKKTENQSENLPEIADFHGVTSITVEQDYDHPPPSPTLDTTPTPLPTPITHGERKRRGHRRKNDKKTADKTNSTRDINTTYTDISSQAATSALNINNSTLSIVLKKQVLTVGTKDFFHVPENTLHFGKTGEPWSPGEPIKHSKGISNSKFTMGMLEIAPGGQKELSCMKSNTLCCLVMSGTVCVEFGNRDTIVSCGAYFYVPPSNHYMITNVDSSQTAKLHFNILKHCNPMNTSNYDM